MSDSFWTIVQYVFLAIFAGYLIYTLLTQKRRYERFQQRYLAPQSADEADSIPFAGTVTAELKREFRALYCTRDLWVQIVFTVLGISLFPMAFIFVRNMMEAPDYGGGVSRIATGALAFGMCVIGVLLIVYALAMPQIWFRWWWWPKYESSFGTAISGEATQVGVRLVAGGEPVLWPQFYAAEMNGQVVLLYLSNAYAYPVHQSMFASQDEWDQFVSMVKEGIQRVVVRSR